ncbi:MAG: hypothetical protein KBD55_00955 [Candidatus Pacebacteria bacterium]|nr:hypothetical protein [Candidatus Paceibacterota bacterium]
MGEDFKTKLAQAANELKNIRGKKADAKVTLNETGAAGNDLEETGDPLPAFARPRAKSAEAESVDPQEDLDLASLDFELSPPNEAVIASSHPKYTPSQVDTTAPIDRLPMYMEETEDSADLNIPEAVKTEPTTKIKTPREPHKINYAQFEETPKTLKEEIREFSGWGNDSQAEETPAAPIIEAQKVETAPDATKTEAEVKMAAIAELEKVIAQAKKTIEDNNKRKEILLKKIAELEASPVEKKRSRSEKFTDLMIEYASVLKKMEDIIKKNNKVKSKVLIQDILDTNSALFSKIASYSDLPQYAIAAKQINARMRAIDEKMGPATRIPTIESARAEIESKRKQEIENLPEIIELKATLENAVNSTKGLEKIVAQSWIDLFNKSILEFLKSQAEDYKNVKGKEARVSEKGFRDQIKKIEKINQKYDAEISKFM